MLAAIVSRVEQAVHLREPERQVVRARDEQRLRGRDEHRRDHEQQDDGEHHEREALLLEPRPAAHVVDAAERRVERAPERRADPDRGDERDDPDRRRRVADVVERGVERPLGGAREDALEVVEHLALDVARLEHAAGDEQREQREREQRQQQVVGDHRRHPGQVVVVGLEPERLEPADRVLVARPRAAGAERRAAPRLHRSSAVGSEGPVNARARRGRPARPRWRQAVAPACGPRRDDAGSGRSRPASARAARAAGRGRSR